MGWIKCSDRLPEYGETVFTCDEHKNINIQMRYYCNNFIGLAEDPHPTHWMPRNENDSLPEPPDND